MHERVTAMADFRDGPQVRSHADVAKRLSSRGGLLLASLAPGQSEEDQARALLGLSGTDGCSAPHPRAAAASTLSSSSSSSAGATAHIASPKLEAFRRRYDQERRRAAAARRREARRDSATTAACATTSSLRTQEQKADGNGVGATTLGAT